MKSALIPLICLALASETAHADDGTGTVKLASQNDFGFNLDSDSHWSQRFHSRVFLNEAGRDNTFLIDYGLTWKPSRRYSLDLTAGYEYSDDKDAHHWLVVVTSKHMRFFDDKLVVSLEGLHHYDGRYRYDGYYAVDWWVVGAHAWNRGSQAAAGFQIGSGPGLDPFRFEIRISFAMTGGLPDRIGCFVMTFDLR